MLGVFIVFILGFLVYNYFSNLNPGITSTTGLSTENTLDSENTYIVEKGDSLWSIAEKKYNDGFRWREIAEANDLAENTVISTGQELIIPNEEETEAIAEVENEVDTETLTDTNNEIKEELTNNGDVYEVQKGDTLWDISVKVYGDGFRWKEIAEANDLANPRIIHQGNSLKIPR